MSKSPEKPNRVPAGADPKVGGHDQLRDEADGIHRGRRPSDLDLRGPHERDESADAGALAEHQVMEQAHADLTSGQVDTDRRQDATEVFEANERAAKERER